jgi:hypothetical protein
MKKGITRTVTAICISTWEITGIIIAVGIISRVNQGVFSIYTGIIKGLFLVFWGLASLSFILLICTLDVNVKAWLTKVMTRKNKPPSAASTVSTGNKGTGSTTQHNQPQYKRLPFSGLLAAFLVIPVLGLVIETYMLIKMDYIMWIFIFVLSLLAILSKLISNTPAENRVIRVHYAFIAALSFSLLIFHNYAFSEPFKKTFLKHAGAIDRWFFAQAAAKSGDNYGGIMKENIKAVLDLKGLKQAPCETFINTFAIYTRGLREDKLGENLLPHQRLENQETIHSIFLQKALNYLEDKQITAALKQQILENLLEYLAVITGKKLIDAIDQSGSLYTLEQIFFEDLEDLIKRLTGNNELEEPGSIAVKWKELLEAVHENYPAVNI